ncbi:YicC/YloC family endoribonuclease [Candidatus Protochlamydia naegleriophila]|nr:YicC/YloC family endoribonuclease [Candidatus Protochlamydia naegleriophila]
MTAFGRANFNTEMGHFTVEIQSVNRKFLEINVQLPRELSYFDVEIKKWLQPYITRGQVTVKVMASFEGKAPFIVVPNLALARQIKEAWSTIAKQLELDGESIDLELLSQSEDILRFEENRHEEENYRQILKQVLDQAVAGFMQMKFQEGDVLLGDMLSRSEKIRQAMKIIEERTPYATKKYREKLMARLEDLLPEHVENEERILREVALFAEKIDIAEEITRFFCHLTRFEERIQGSDSSVGKTLEFILQELGREVNTIGSKSSDIEIARLVIDIKSELERIREQIQNIE